MKMNKQKKKIKNKKAQEEMVGFVIIILMVIIIGVVFLAFSLRQKPTTAQHQESMMLDTMQAMLSYSACESNMRGLIKECVLESDKKCENKAVCDYVKSAMEAMLAKSLGSSIADSYVKGYILNISNSKQLVYTNKGNFTGNYFGATIPIQVSGQDIDFNLRFYYATTP